MNNDWQTKEALAVIQELRSSERGLSSHEAKLRLSQYGQNKLPEAKFDSLFTVFFNQFKSPLIYILLSASVIVFFINEIVDGAIILAVLIFNAVVGTIQEGKAQNTLRALSKFVETRATVIRDNKEVILADTELVPGDVIVLQEGEKVPADARILFSHNLKADEAALTGESEPVHKISEAMGKKESLNHSINIVYKGTNIVVGNGQAVVVATGLQTVMGAIAHKIVSVHTEIPLKGNIRYLSRLIIATVAVISISVFTLGLLAGESFKTMFATVVSLAVSIVPEGLPVVVTLILAMGVWRMGKRNALVKKMQAVEALGQARLLAVDKTGTITKNELLIKKVYTGDKIFDIEGVGYEPKGAIQLNNQPIDPANYPDLLLSGKISAFCANARTMYDEKENRWKVAGDPTEAAMLVLAQKIGFHKDSLDLESPNIGEIPFDYKLKYHAVLQKMADKNLLAVVGAPETILELSKTILSNGKDKPLDLEERKKIEAIFYQMAREGLRVVGFAVDRDAGKNLKPENIKNLSFVGFYGMEDTVRPEAAVAIKSAISAGVAVVMITGDNKITAQAIAKQVGIWRERDVVLTGTEINEMSDDELAERINNVSVFARVTPDHKMRIISAYRAKGVVVAMTGDGVNDAPSLVAADLGVSMGGIGTEVAKEASDIVLLDDNLNSIISAIEEGRSIYKTIKKVILYLFSTSMGEVLVITGALLLSYPVPILPAQIIWLNFVTDGFLNVALATEPKEANLLTSKFEKPKKYLLDKLMGKRMLLMSVVMAIGTLYLFIKYYQVDSAKAWTISLTVMAVFQWFNAWNCRSEKKSIFQMNPFSNKFLLGATGLVILLQVLAIHTPILQKILRTVPLNFYDWLAIISVATSIIIAEEIRKLFVRKSARKILKKL
jgi:Ca2+-transporting ATPase